MESVHFLGERLLGKIFFFHTSSVDGICAYSAQKIRLGSTGAAGERGRIRVVVVARELTFFTPGVGFSYRVA